MYFVIALIGLSLLFYLSSVQLSEEKLAKSALTEKLRELRNDPNLNEAHLQDALHVNNPKMFKMFISTRSGVRFVLKELIGEKNADEYLITAFDQPMRYHKEQYHYDLVQNGVSSSAALLVCALVLFFVIRKNPHPHVDTETQSPRFTQLAVASLVLGIYGWLILPFLGSIAAVVLGHLARKRIKTDPMNFKGKGMAIAGLIIGYLGVVSMASIVYLYLRFLIK